MIQREIYQVIANIVDANGTFNALTGYPKTFDSRNYNATEANPDGDADKAFRVAKADYCAQMSAFLASDARAMWTVTLTRSNGRQMASECFGAFPDVTPVTPEETA